MSVFKIEKPKTRSERFRFVFFCVCELFAIGSCVYACFSGVTSKILICLFSVLLLPLPTLIAKWLHFTVPTPLYIGILCYAVCPMLGHAYHFYYLIPWWDTFLHACGGVVFAMFGAYLPTLFDKDKAPSLLLCALFGFCFSVTISALWEFIEYGCDRLLGSDMQQDAIIDNIYSYLLGEQTGVIGSITDIENVIVNGKVLTGYIDIGLIDTMTDMLFETLGALVYTLLYLFDRKQRFSLHALPIDRNATV